MAKLALLIAGLAAAGLILRTAGVAPERWLRDPGPWGEAMFLLAGAALTAAGVPRGAVAFAGGYAFGAALGSAVALIAQVFGAALAYGWARAVGRAWAERRLASRFGARIRPLVAALQASPFSATLALRLLPAGSNVALNLLAGAVALPPTPFLAASALGYLPQTVLFALLGKGVRVDGAWQLAGAAGLLAASLALGWWSWRRHRAARALAG